MHLSLVPPAFNAFESVSEDEVQKIINDSLTKSCLLDPMLTFLLKYCFDILLPCISKLVSYSLSKISFPKSLLSPLLYRRLHFSVMNPVSGLCLLSNLVERVIGKQFTSHTDSNKLGNPNQSPYKPVHSTEIDLRSIIY